MALNLGAPALSTAPEDTLITCGPFRFVLGHRLAPHRRLFGFDHRVVDWMFASEACLELISVEHVARSVDVIRTDMFDQTAGGKTLWELTGGEGKDTSRDATETVDRAGRVRGLFCRWRGSERIRYGCDERRRKKQAAIPL